MWKKSEPEDPQPQHQYTLPTQAPQTPPVVQSRSSTAPTKERAIIGPTIHIKGDLTGQEDLLIEGWVEGKIELRRHDVTVGKNGRVRADIFGKTITIEGEVHGNLYGEEQLLLKQAGTVRGNIIAPRVSLEDGANFKGSIDMAPKDAAKGPVDAEILKKPSETVKIGPEPVTGEKPGRVAGRA